MQNFDLTWLLDARILIAAAVGLVLGLYALVIMRKYVRIAIANMENQAFVPENGNGEIAPWVGQEVRFTATDGHPLSGTLMQATREGGTQQKSRGAVIFAHEFASDRSIATRYCRPLVEQGYDVFAFDFRGHGTSAGEPGYLPRQWPTERETADLSGAIAYMHDYLARQDRPVKIALFGLSRGASSAILTAPRHEEVQAIISDGAYSSDIATEYFMRRFATIFAKVPFIARSHPPVFWKLMRAMVFQMYERRTGCRFPFVRKTLRRMGRMPMLFIHGEKDSYIPVAHCQMLYDLAYGPKSLWIVPNARHNQCVKVDAEGYFGRIVRFLDEHISVERAAVRSIPTRVRRHEPAITVPATTYVPALVQPQREPTATAV